MNGIFEQLSETINKFYPPELSQIPSGKYSDEWLTVLHKKFADVNNGGSNVWKQIIQEITTEMSLPVTDNSYLEFPGYRLEIAVGETMNTPDILCKRSLVLAVSLLCPYYTVYFKDDYRIFNVKKEPRSHPTMLKVVFSEIMPELFPAADQYLKITKQITEKGFVGYEYLRHRFLMNRTVGGLYYLPTEGYPTPHSIYTYLFDNLPKFLMEIKP